eukprot:355127-Chlamydomonas_euryale.AAC.6
MQPWTSWPLAVDTYVLCNPGHSGHWLQRLTHRATYCCDEKDIKTSAVQYAACQAHTMGPGHPPAPRISPAHELCNNPACETPRQWRHAHRMTACARARPCRASH